MWSGRLCNAKFQVYQHLFDSASAIDAALQSADYYAAAGELSRYYDAINNVACVYEQLLDTVNALHILEFCVITGMSWTRASIVVIMPGCCR